jgi:hypothetical protein
MHIFADPLTYFPYHSGTAAEAWTHEPSFCAGLKILPGPLNPYLSDMENDQAPIPEWMSGVTWIDSDSSEGSELPYTPQTKEEKDPNTLKRPADTERIAANAVVGLITGIACVCILLKNPNIQATLVGAKHYMPDIGPGALASSMGRAVQGLKDAVKQVHQSVGNVASDAFCQTAHAANGAAYEVDYALGFIPYGLKLNDRISVPADEQVCALKVGMEKLFNS